MNNENFTMLCDYYELTMANAYFCSGKANEIAYFDVFFRQIPDGGGFAIAAGLEQLAEYISDLKFTEENIAFLREKGGFSEDFLNYLKSFKFHGDIYAVPEGTPVFPNEPLVTVRAPIIEAQIIETFALICINHQSLIATKANRIVRAAGGKSVLEFGSRRAQGAQGAILGARAAFIGGCDGTACTITGERFGIPVVGTMAHSWVQMFDDEEEAFKTYCRLYPNSSTLLVDTYNVLKSGVPNAIKAFKEVLLPQGINNFAIRLDSGDFTYLSKKARKMLDNAGLPQCRIVVSNSLDEYIIRDLELQGAEINVYSVGERLITSKSSPVMGGVYKLVAVEKDGGIVPKIKISENASKVTTPHFKTLRRIYDRQSGKAMADLLSAYDEEIDENQPLELFDPDNPWKRKTFSDFTLEKLQKPIFLNGQCVYSFPEINEIKRFCKERVDALWDEVKRFENPHNYYVDLSRKLYDIKQVLLRHGGN